mmetsp:Transcript_43231/g.72068  ORF Transcript_43231/g.72068 Transcript_43231/m.72068 type:complete len:206 (-) Transcript_43231:668-1285(-)
MFHTRQVWSFEQVTTCVESWLNATDVMAPLWPCSVITLSTLTFVSMAPLPQDSSQILTSAVKVAAAKKRPSGDMAIPLFTSWLVFTISTSLPVDAYHRPRLVLKLEHDSAIDGRPVALAAASEVMWNWLPCASFTCHFISGCLPCSLGTKYWQRRVPPEAPAAAIITSSALLPNTTPTACSRSRLIRIMWKLFAAKSSNLKIRTV